MGVFGGWFGSRENAPTYVAAALAIFFALCFMVVLFAPLGSGIERRDASQTIAGFFLAALGYMFGSLSGGGK